MLKSEYVGDPRGYDETKMRKPPERPDNRTVQDAGERISQPGTGPNTHHKQARRAGVGIEEESVIKDETFDTAHHRQRQHQLDLLDSKKHVKFAENGAAVN